jgi:hypothetical protein
MTTALGCDALIAKLNAVYNAPEENHWGTIVSYADGGPDPLDGISAYRVENPPHWHYVTFGFSELGDKRSDDPEVSGWGFELSFRLDRRPEETEAPEWPVSLLQKLARYVFNTRCPFDHEHYIRWGGPITKEEDTALEALVFTGDPILGQINTPNGRVKFLTVIGITSDEHDFAAEAGPDQLLNLLLAQNPLGITHLTRPSLLAD